MRKLTDLSRHSAVYYNRLSMLGDVNHWKPRVVVMPTLWSLMAAGLSLWHSPVSPLTTKMTSWQFLVFSGRYCPLIDNKNAAFLVSLSIHKRHQKSISCAYNDSLEKWPRHIVGILHLGEVYIIYAYKMHTLSVTTRCSYRLLPACCNIHRWHEAQ